VSALIYKIERILTDTYSIQNYVELMTEILDGLQLVDPNTNRKEYSNFSSHIESSTHVGNYICPDNKKIIVMSVELKKHDFVKNSRSTQRSYAKKLIENANADGALIAYHTADDTSWRLSFVRLDYHMQIEKGKHKVKESITPARRYSFLVGKGEPCHTAVSRLRFFLDKHKINPTLDELEDAFSVEAVTKEFFELYKEKYHQIRDCLENNDNFIAEAKLHNFNSAQFAKKLMGQIVFLYFLQKKGWLGVSAWPKEMSATEYKRAYFSRGTRSRQLIPFVYKKTEEDCYLRDVEALKKLSDEEETFLSTCVNGEPWGTGPYNFMRRLFEISEKEGANFFEDYLEPLFYSALNVNRGEQGYYPALKCRIPFLSGGLFEPLDGYEWEHNNFNIPNDLFSNKSTREWEADGILDIFDRYNFTMSEDEPLEREVAIDPEMLGKVFENLLDVTDRKSKGAFYTPREIVHYMCQESLIIYLTRVMKVKELAVRDFILFGDFMKDEDANVLNRAKAGDSYDLWISEELYLLDNDGSIVVDRMAELDHALQVVRIADPAVGSGAFVLGMLNEIVRARQNITTYMDITQKIRDPKGASREIRYRRIHERSAHRLKYETIRDCIFAVDIEPSAVDIAQLRLWLALVIDDEVNPTATSPIDGHRNPLPLPNLECNILCGDSLLDEFGGCKLINESALIGNLSTGRQIDMFQSAFDAALERLIVKQEELFRCEESSKKTVLLSEIEELRNSIIMTQLAGSGDDVIEQYEETRDLVSKPYVLWQLDFVRVFREKGGFDILIGNPPYIQLQKTIDENSGKKLGDLYSSYGFKTFARIGDIYCLFYEKGNILLRPGGILAYITSNKWMRAAYGKLLRQYLANNTNPLYLIDFAGTKVFLSATVDVNILIFAKESNQGKTMACIAKDDCLNNLSVFVTHHKSVSSFSSSDSWIILSAMEERIKRKIDIAGVPLHRWDIKIFRGILTGFNPAFIISGNKRTEIIAADSKSAEIIRPILRGRDIKRYEYTFADLWLITTFPSKKYDIENYLGVKNHLLSFGIHKLEQTGAIHIINGEEIKARKRTNNKWFETQDSISYWDDFSKQRIVYREISDSMDACLVEPNYFVNNKCYMISGNHLIFLLSFFNSKLFHKIIFQQTNLTGGKGEAFVSSIRVPIPSNETERLLVNLYYSRNGASENELRKIEYKVDCIICNLYGLSDEETAYILSQ
jgi:adenine-specific DNA-methyltransferase